MSRRYALPATKTTFILSDSRRVQLKSLAAQRGTTVTKLLEEATDLVLEKYKMVEDQETLKRRSGDAWERVRGGLFKGPNVALSIDEIVYGITPRRAKLKKRTKRSKRRGRKGK